jgi:hypothetical protein
MNQCVKQPANKHSSDQRAFIEALIEWVAVNSISFCSIDHHFVCWSSFRDLRFSLLSDKGGRKANGIAFLGICIILIGSLFVISSSFNFILHNAPRIPNAHSIMELSRYIILIGSLFVMLSSFAFTLWNTSPLCKAQNIVELGLCIILMGSKLFCPCEL